jgi:alpha-D-ribose 1-methylphosphonate 5-triphosphate synthase subunit PhnG
MSIEEVSFAMNATRVYRLSLKPKSAAAVADALLDQEQAIKTIARELYKPRNPTRRELFQQAKACATAAKQIRRHTSGDRS